MRNEQEINRVIDLYADTIKRLCMLHLHNTADAEDIFQTVFLKYLHHSGEFDNAEHEKAWFIRVTVNACKDLQRSFFRSRTVALDCIEEQVSFMQEDHREVLEAVLKLPLKYRKVIYLHFYEGYTIVQIADILGKNQNTIYTHLNRAKALLRKQLKEED